MDNLSTERQYGIFRFLLGVYLFVHFAHLLPWSAEVFSDQGMIPVGHWSPLFHLFPSVLALSDGPWMVCALMAAGLAGSVLMMAGRHDRWAALGLWYVLACLFARNPLIANPALPYVGWMLLMHAWMGSKPTRPMFLAAWVVLALSYSYSGYTKLLSPSWVNGDTVSLVLHNPLARDHALRDWLLGLPQEFLRALTWTILWVELLFAPLALITRLRPLLWGAMLVVQFGFLLLLNFADLTTPMMLFHLLTFDPAWVRRTQARTGETLYYDGDCGLCHRVVRFVLSEDMPKHFTFAPLQGDSFARAMPLPKRAALPDSFVIVDDTGRMLTKGSAVIHMLGRLGGLWRVLGAIFSAVPKGIRDFGYSCVGAVRHRLFARPEGLCPMVPQEQRDRFRP